MRKERTAGAIMPVYYGLQWGRNLTVAEGAKADRDLSVLLERFNGAAT